MAAQLRSLRLYINLYVTDVLIVDKLERAALVSRNKGNLDAGEVAALLRSLRLPSSPAEAAAAIRRLDADGDGEIQFEEFKARLLCG